MSGAVHLHRCVPLMQKCVTVWGVIKGARWITHSLSLSHTAAFFGHFSRVDSLSPLSNSLQPLWPFQEVISFHVELLIREDDGYIERLRFRVIKETTATEMKSRAKVYLREINRFVNRICQVAWWITRTVQWLFATSHSSHYDGPECQRTSALKK